MEGLDETTRHLSQDRRCCGPDVNIAPLKCESRTRYTGLLCWGLSAYKNTIRSSRSIDVGNTLLDRRFCSARRFTLSLRWVGLNYLPLCMNVELRIFKIRPPWCRGHTFRSRGNRQMYDGYGFVAVSGPMLSYGVWIKIYWIRNHVLHSNINIFIGVVPLGFTICLYDSTFGRN
jgi:hypothetical protein